MCDLSTPSDCVCAEINTRHCPVHGQGSLCSFRDLRGREKFRTGPYPWDEGAASAPLVTVEAAALDALLDAAETAFGLVLAMERDAAAPRYSLNVKGCRDELWGHLRRFEEVERA